VIEYTVPLSNRKGADIMMNDFITSNTRRLGRVVVVLILAVAALVLLLSTWSGLPTAEARESAAAKSGSEDLSKFSTTLDDTTIFLPMILNSDVVFFDDFSDSNSGWPEGDYGDCEYAYTDGRYRIRVTDYGARCYAPNLLVPKQVNGTFSVRARRTSDEDRHMLYGLVFGAMPVPYATENHWALEIFPNDDSDCDDKPFYWLVAVVDDQQEYFEDVCTDAIDKDRNDWNELKVIRNGKNIDIYINGSHKGAYDDADELLTEGFSFVEVLSVSDETITVEFDDFEILRTTTP
jgi:heat shock protein HspQ